MASSSSNPKRSYHVFLSFRGPDVRNNFLDYLYTALNQTGLYTYIDNEELRKGEQISSALMKAIEESQIALVIFSKDYASSSWCLEELAKIMECKVENDLIVLPVFYKVEPREVREGRESYRRAMAKHELRKDSDTVKIWKKALFDAGNLSGWDFSDGDEADLIKRIVKEISMRVDRTPLYVAKHPVGMLPRVAKLESMLNLEYDDNVLMIGLWGQGGIGKTALSKALYNAIFRQFEGSCFLANVREASKDSKDFVSLQEKLLFEILRKNLTVFSVDGGINLMQDRLSRKKVLLVLDDVNEIKQLNALAGECEWFGKGSRIIITTRDKHLLTSYGIGKDLIYEVKTLEPREALELFDKHAFQSNNKIVIRRDLVESTLCYANGLPLALEVLGSFLCGRREREWESALNKLAKSPDKTINGVLKLSYDGLEDYAKEIFLDIACFFKGRSTKYIMKVLDCCDFDPTIGVQVLVEKSLIFEEAGTLQMHDLMQLMGMDIVKQECPDDLGRRSRLWLCDDVRDVLSGNMGTNAVKAIVLDIPKPEEMNIGPDAFTNMKRLRMLILINVLSSFRGPICLPNELRWFEWPECPPWFPKFSSGTKKLVGLDLHKSNIQVVREQFKGFEKMKFMNFSECQSLVCMPDLSYTPNLEKLDLHGCKNLEHAHESAAYHRKLKLLNLQGCSKLQKFLDIPEKNESLRVVYLGGTSIGELPASIENLVSLEVMHLKFCKKLAILPSSIYRLRNVKNLSLQGCSKLIKFPEMEEGLSDPHMKTGFPNLICLNLEECNLSEVEFLKNYSCFPFLRELMLSSNNFSNLPTCGQLYNLSNLFVRDCKQLQEIPKFPRKLRHLWADRCVSLSRIPSNIDVESLSLDSCQKLVHNGFSANDWFKLEKFNHYTDCEVVLPGGEMPKWMIPNKEGYISVVASKDLYKKILGVAFCVVFQGKRNAHSGLIAEAFVNRISTKSTLANVSSDLDHVWLVYMKSKEVWTVNDFGPNDFSHFQVIIRADKQPDNKVTVRKCGFRLICKSLENDSEVLVPDDQLLDPALLYEVSHEDSPMSIEEESSSETEDLQDNEICKEEEQLNMAHFSIEKYRYSKLLPYQNVCRGGEMPKEFVLVEDDTISFVASQDLYDKIVRLALCVVFGVEDGKKEVSLDIVPHVHGQRRNGLSGTLGSFDSDHTWFQLLKPDVLWGVLEGAVDFSQFEESCLRFSLMVKVSGGIMKKLGYLLSCKRLEDDLKLALEDDQLMDPASVSEDFDFEEDSWRKSDSLEYLSKYHIGCENRRGEWISTGVVII